MAVSDIQKKQRYHHGDLAAALIAAIRVLIERDGPGDFSLAEACKMAGVSTAAPYRHFADKHEMLCEVAESGFRELTQAMLDRLQAVPDTGPARIAAIGKVYVAFAMQNPGTFRLMFGSDVKQDEDVHCAGDECFGVLISEVAQQIGAAFDSEDSMTLSVMLWSFVHGVASLALDGDYEAAGVEVDTDRMLELAAQRFLAAPAPGPAR